jgi:uncharacterized protein (TIGR02646 family)
MKNICKSSEPPELEKYKEKFLGEFKRWKTLAKARSQLKKDVKDAIRTNLEIDQKGLCAYCEINLHEQDCSVDHFIPCEQSTQAKNYDLAWLNMLVTCRGGLQNITISEENYGRRNSQPPNNFCCCNAAKGNFMPDGRLLNPLDLPTLRLFTVSSLDGEVRPDEIACRLAEVSIEYAQFTIEKLGLNVQRLKNERLRKVKEIEEEREILDDGIISKIDLDKKIAQMFFRDGTKNWPPFFTTIRSILGEGAEQHLKEISYSG